MRRISPRTSVSFDQSEVDPEEHNVVVEAMSVRTVEECCIFLADHSDDRLRISHRTTIVRTAFGWAIFASPWQPAMVNTSSCLID